MDIPLDLTRTMQKFARVIQNHCYILQNEVLFYRMNLIDAFTPAADEITAVVPVQSGLSTSEDGIELPTSASVTSFLPLPLKVHPKRN